MSIHATRNSKKRTTSKKRGLKRVGYSPKSPAVARHMALNKAVKKYGVLRTLRRLKSMKKRSNMKRTYKRDINFVKRSHFN
jgi:hypothetical protein